MDLKINPINVIMDYNVWEEQEQFNTWRRLIVNVFNEIMKMHECSNCSVNLLLTNNETIRELNKNFRNVDKTTNILSFPQINVDHTVIQFESDRAVIPIDINNEEQTTSNINTENYEDNVNVKNIKSIAPLFKLKDINIGDLAMSYEVIMEESKIFNKKFFDRCTHLFVHGVLHLLGMDHIEEDERLKMESLEIKILENFCIKNPYFVD